ncbi:mug158 [Symbiodinium sp. CCMP2456]|nr:mug158 [Symbiodinium sp. CCMP2456]
MGTALTSVTYEEPELCSDAEFECAPGVCVLCPAGSCQCDGWQDCENGADEDVWGVLLQRNVNSLAIGLLLSARSTKMAQSLGMIHALTSQAFLATVAWMQVWETCYEMTASVAVAMHPRCVPISRTCDGVQDCPGGEDEEGCPSLPESDDSNSSDNATWVAAVFFDSTEIKCAKLAQPDGVVTPEVQLMACSLEAVAPQVLDVAKATFMRTEVDNANGQVSFGALRCAVGPNLKNHEIIGLATAEMAYNADNTSKVVKCYCMQRMYLEPEVFLALAETDKRATMCAEYIGISQGNYHRSWIRVGIIVLFNELFEALIRGTSTSVRYKDETTRLVRHFRNLFWFWLLNSALIPAFVSCTIPARGLGGPRAFDLASWGFYLVRPAFPRPSGVGSFGPWRLRGRT